MKGAADSRPRSRSIDLKSSVSNSGVAVQTWPKFSGGSTVEMRRPLEPVESLFTKSAASQAWRAGGAAISGPTFLGSACGAPRAAVALGPVPVG